MGSPTKNRPAARRLRHRGPAVLAGLSLLAGCSLGNGGVAGGDASAGVTSAPGDTASTTAVVSTTAIATTTGPLSTSTTEAATTTSGAASTSTTSTVPRIGWIALTFDDGPVEGTYRILDILDEYGVKATFFLSAWRLPANDAIARDIVARGHGIQSHGYLHDDWTTLSNDAVQRDVERASELIFAATGVMPRCVRPPFGRSSDRTTGIVESLGYEVIGWDENSEDYAHQSSAELVRRAAEWKPNTVVLAHDTNHYIWAPVLGQVIEILQGRGLELVTICED